MARQCVVRCRPGRLVELPPATGSIAVLFVGAPCVRCRAAAILPPSGCSLSRIHGFAFTQFFSCAPRQSHRSLDVRIGRVLVKEQHDLAARALARVTVLQPPRAIAKKVLAACATDLDGIFHDNSNIDEQRGRSQSPRGSNCRLRNREAPRAITVRIGTGGSPVACLSSAIGTLFTHGELRKNFVR